VAWFITDSLPPLTVMPQKEACENHKLWMKTDNEASHSCYTGVTNLIQLMTERTNELLNVVGLVALTFCSELIPTQGDIHILVPVH
jgi:hypothetical protein